MTFKVLQKVHRHLISAAACTLLLVLAGASAEDARDLPPTPSPTTTLESAVWGDPAPTVSEGMGLLNQAAEAYQRSDLQELKRLLDAAIEASPRLGAAYITRGEYWLTLENYAKAEADLRIGLDLLDQADQPRESVLPSIGPAPVSVDELAGDALVLHGYCLIKLAQEANVLGDEQKEQVYILDAQSQLQEALRKEPSSERKEMARELLRMFR